MPAPVSEKAPLESATGRFLAGDVRSDADHPPFARSRVDGYAVVAADTASGATQLPLVCEVPAGRAPGDRIEPGQAARVFTGAPVPDGADAVVMQERCEVAEGPVVRVGIAVRPGAHIIARGTECREGDVVAAPGQALTSALVGALATVGVTEPEVWRRPRARLVSTGDELVAVEEIPGPGQIRNSNAPAIAAALGTAGARVEGSRRAGDTREALSEAGAWALEADWCTKKD